MPAHALLPAVNRLLKQVEETSGLPVAVAQQSDLSTLATLRPATPEYQAHVIAYRDADEASSYHVAFEAALLLRIVQVPAEQRVILRETRQAREKVVSSVERMFKGQISLAQARGAGLQYYDELLLRLRSTGPGFWADRWLVEQAPELRGFQAALLQSHVHDNLFCLEAEVERLTPTAVLQATRAISAACAFHAAELLGIPTLAIPYQAAGFEALAKELIAITRAEPTTADPVREIVDAWAEKLGLSRWYVWKTP
ncbi:hypothetical protein NZK33_07275 [Cyanobium sp. FGCU-6]|nr:hypothetical protein [Cyanobium sp. FGCU6]